MIRCKCGREFKDKRKLSEDLQFQEHIEQCLRKIKGYKGFKEKHRAIAHTITW